jgi:hypothetical protein
LADRPFVWEIIDLTVRKLVNLVEELVPLQALAMQVYFNSLLGKVRTVYVKFFDEQNSVRHTAYHLVFLLIIHCHSFRYWLSCCVSNISKKLMLNFTVFLAAVLHY